MIITFEDGSYIGIEKTTYEKIYDKAYKEGYEAGYEDAENGIQDIQVNED